MKLFNLRFPLVSMDYKSTVVAGSYNHQAATIRIQMGPEPPLRAGDCPEDQTCERTMVDNGDGAISVCCQCVSECDCRPGDSDNSGDFNIGDAVYIINYVFKGGPAPQPYALYSGDPNYDCTLNVGDAVYIINFIFKGGPPPCDCPAWVSACGFPIR